MKKINIAIILFILLGLLLTAYFNNDPIKKQFKPKTYKAFCEILKVERLNKKVIEETTQLNLLNKGIKDLKGIKLFKNLEKLYFFSNQITDISPLAELTNLRILDLGCNQITDISPLAELTNLKILSLVKNKITDISPLYKLTALEKIHLDGNKEINQKDIDSLKQYLKNCKNYD